MPSISSPSFFIIRPRLSVSGKWQRERRQRRKRRQAGKHHRPLRKKSPNVCWVLWFDRSFDSMSTLTRFSIRWSRVVGFDFDPFYGVSLNLQSPLLIHLGCRGKFFKFLLLFRSPCKVWSINDILFCLFANSECEA